jgi:hypothetical protein
MAESLEDRRNYISYSVLINGLEVNAVYRRESIEGIFLPLLRKLTKMQKEKDDRVLALLAAPPGAGKSTLLSFLEKLALEDELSGEAVTEADTEEETLLNDLEEDVPDGYIYWGVKTDQYLLNMPAETLGGSTGSAEGDNSWFDMYTECYVSSGFAAGNTLYTVTWYHPDGTFEQVNLLQGRSGSGTYKLTSNFLILRENNGSEKDHLNEYHYYVKDGIIYQTVYLKQSNTNMP